MLLGLLDFRGAECGPGPIAVLTLENRRRICRDQLVFFQNELLIKPVTRRLINGLAAERAPEFVLVIIVAAEAQLLPVRRELFLFVQDHEFRGGPGLTRFANVSPEFVNRSLEISMANKIIAGRFRRNFCCLIDSDLLNAGWLRRSASGEEKKAEKNFESEEQLESTFAHGQFPLSQGS